MGRDGTFSDDSSDPLLRRFLPGPQIELHLLGGFDLRVNATPVALVTAAQRLLALVALTGPLPRSRAAGNLWPDADEHSASGCVRTALWRCNRAAAHVIEAVGDQLRLNSCVHVDALTTGSPGSELLPGWDDDWLIVERERVRQRRLHELDNVAHSLTSAALYGPALQVALRALALDPLRESAHRTVIGIHLAEGNHVEAVRSYHRCARVLRRELGVAPCPATTALVAGAVDLTGSATLEP